MVGIASRIPAHVQLVLLLLNDGLLLQQHRNVEAKPLVEVVAPVVNTGAENIVAVEVLDLEMEAPAPIVDFDADVRAREENP